MSCSRLLRPIQVTLSTDTTTNQYFFPDQWIPIDDAAVMDYSLLLRNVTGNFTAKPADQLCSVRPDNPDAPSIISAGSAASSNGFTHYHETSRGGGNKAYIRTGLCYALSSGSSLGFAQVTLLPSIHTCVRPFRPVEIAIHPGMMGATDINYAPLTGWEPTVGFSKFKAWFVVTENQSDYLEYQLAMRTAVDPRAPNAWQTAETGYTNPSSNNTERNTGELSAPGGASITSNMFWQAGLAFRKKSGAGGNPRAMVNATTAVIHA